MLQFVFSMLSVAQSPAHATSCDGEETSIPKMPSRPVQIDIFNQKMANLPGPQDVVFVGDSLVQFWPDKSLREAALSPRFFNFGVGLDRTENLLWRLQAPQLPALNPKTAVILIGANNLRANNSACAIAAGIEAVAGRVRDIWPKANRILIQVLPQGDDFSYQNDNRQQTNTLVREYLERSTNVRVLNVDSLITCNFEPSCPNYLADHLHLSQVGYETLGKVVARAIRTSSR
ncbi:GDSL-type esterase/lipase family protein [Methylobacterium sp. SI9]|uniref:GDSL-type esterase/lipase family protein n=1 Tax=Methylobacterium guangdongense TaxID=3138811 RepID=UPI00313CE2B2